LSIIQEVTIRHTSDQQVAIFIDLTRRTQNSI
jgi:hypothetical protein